MTKASGMLLLLCSFCKMYAQLYIGKSCDLNIKDNIIISLIERKDSLVSLYIKADTKVHNLQQMSNIKIVVLSSYLSKPLQSSCSDTIKKAKKKQEEKRVLKLISEQKISRAENGKSTIIFYGKSEDIAIIITNTFKEKQGILHRKHKIFILYEKQFCPEQSLKTDMYERAFLAGLQIRPPPSFKFIL
ncbi:hypothetical protein ACWKWW_13050 [Chryseobacterium cucumeris]